MDLKSRNQLNLEVKLSLYLVNRLPFTLFQSSKYFRLDSCKFKAEATLIETARVFFQMKEEILSLTC